MEDNGEPQFVAPLEHPMFERAEKLSDPYLRKHFPKNVAEAHAFERMLLKRPLAARVLVVAITRVETAWCAFVDAVPGRNHDYEADAVANYGTKLDEPVARVLFPVFDEVPYAK